MRPYVLVVVLSAAACTGHSVRPSSDGGEGPAEVGGEFAADAALPPAGACVVVRDLRARTTESVEEPTRLSDGFAYVGGLPQPTFAWLLLDETGASRQTTVAAPFFPYLRPTTIGAVREPRLLLFDRSDAPVDDSDWILVQVLLPDGTALGPTTPVLSAFDRGTASYPLAVALDGHRAAVGNAHPTTRDPHFVLVDDTGRAAGAEVRLFDSGDKPSFRCFTLTGTAHGAAGAALDATTGTFHMAELDPSGHVVNQATWPITDQQCPTIRPLSDGIYVSFKAPVGTPEAGTTTVTRLSATAFEPIATLPAPPEGSTYAWVAPGAQPLVAVIRSTTISFARLQNGTVVPLAAEFPRGTLVPSPDNRLFLSHRDTNYATSPAETTVSVVEVTCGDPGTP